MTDKDLMAPRYEVIADYPGSYLKIGDVFEEDNITKFMGKYPHLFRKLSWWEKLKEGEWPEYIKSDNGVFELCIEGENFKGVPLVRIPSAGQWPISMFLPATETEYNNYLKSKQ